MCPLSDGSHGRGELLARAPAAIAEQDQPSALQLLRELAEGDRRGDETLAPAVGDALVAIARGAKQDDADRVALARLNSIEGSPTLAWGQGTPTIVWSRPACVVRSYKAWPSRLMTAAMWRARI